MKILNSLIFIFLLSICSYAEASTYVKRYPTDTAVLVCQPSDTDSNCGGGGSGSGNVGIGTANWIAYYPSNGSTVAANSNIRLVGSNVGIGSPNPGQSLDVQGTIRVIGTNPVIFGSDNKNYIQSSASSGGDLDVFTNNLQRFTILNDGNASFGLSSSSPVDRYKLDVVGSNTDGMEIYSTQSNSNIYLTALAAGAGIRNWLMSTNYDNSGDFTIRSSNSQGGDPYASGTTRFMISNAGNVAIGSTTDAVNKLDVAGSAVIGSSYAGTNTAPTSGLLVQGNVGVGSVTPGQKLDVQGTVRMTGFQMTNAATTGYVLTASDTAGNAAWTAAASGSSQWTTINTNDVFLPNRGNVGIGTNLTTTSALTVMNGNVGIGTWVPPAALSVTSGNMVLNAATNVQSSGLYMGSGGIYSVGGITAAASNPGNVSTLLNTVNTGTTVGTGSQLALKNNDAGSSPRITASISSVTTAQTSGAQSGDMYFSTINGGTVTERMRLTSAGNVGIGTSLPVGAMDVEGTVSPVIFYGITSGNVGVGTTIPGALFQVGTNALGVTSGNVGIGTNAPSPSGLDPTANKVLRLGGTSVPVIVLASTNSAQQVEMIHDGSTFGIKVAGHGTATNNAIAFYTGNTNSSYSTSERMRIDSTGNVGIGISSSIAAPIEVSSAYGAGDKITSMFFNTNGNGYMDVGTSASVSHAINFGYDDTNNYGTFKINGDSAGTGVVVDDGGNVGINTTVAGSSLSVSGGVAIGATYATQAAPLGGIIASGNVGIGTSLPSYLLHLKDSITGSTQPADLGLILQDSQATPRQGGFYFGGTNDFVVGSKSNSLASFVVNDHARIVVNTTNLIDLAPVSGGGSSRVRIYAPDNGTNSILEIWGNSAQAAHRNWGLQSNDIANGDFAFLQSTSNTTAPSVIKMYLDNAGNLGIGSSVPGQKLDVQGTVRALGYMSSDSSLGVTGSTCTAWKNGLCTSL